MEDKIVDIMETEAKVIETYFILDNKFMTWKEGLIYLQTTKKLSEKKASSWILEKKSIQRIFINEVSERKTIPTFKKWKQEIINHYKNSTLQQGLKL